MGLTLLGCGGSSGSDAGVDAGDAGSDGGFDAGYNPSPPGTCMPNPGSTGNSLNVGAYCTPGGNQCAQYGNLVCSIDVDTSGGDFCILLSCESNSACGNDACCTGNGGAINACVPILCLVNDAGQGCPPIPGKDAGPDGG